jgi:translocation and assembly module TamB
LASNRARLIGKVSGEVDLSLAEFFTSSMTRVTSIAKVNGTVSGTIKKPEIDLVASSRGGGAQFRPLDAGLENIQMDGTLSKGVLTLQRFESDLGGGKLQGRGVIEFYPDKLPRIDLSANLTGNRVRVFPFQFVRMRGRVGLVGTQFPYTINGRLVADSGLIREKVMGNKNVTGAGGYAPGAVYRLEGDLPRFQLDVDAEADGGILVKNDLFDAELKGKVKIVNTVEAPRVLGSAEVVGGTLNFKDRVFQIQSGQVKFDNPAVLNPIFDMAATSEVNGIKISLFSAGRMDKFKVDLSSNPVMPEQEILSLLALGISNDDPRRVRSADRSTVEQTEAASLVLHSLDFNRDVQDKTGLQIQLDEASGTAAGTSAFRPRADNESTAAPKIVIRRRIGRRWNLAVGSTVGVGTNAQKEVSAEYQVTPGFSILGVWDTLEAADRLDSRTSFGLDLKLQKRFR